MIEDIFGATNKAIGELSPNLRYTLSAAKDENGYTVNEVDWDSFTVGEGNTERIPTQVEILTRREEVLAGAPMRRLRAARDQKLADTDWVVVRATDRGEPVPSEWRDYRQALRDITNHYTSLEDVVWPVSP